MQAIGGKRALNFSLDAALVQRARRVTGNLSETVETLLGGYVAAEEAKIAVRQARLAETIGFLNARDDRQGVWADEFPALMAQFDVHEFRSQLDRDVRYLVVLQSNAFEDYRRRLVAPLAMLHGYSGGMPELTPGFEIDGRTVFLLPLLLASVPLARLGRLAGSLADDASAERIIRALDLAISRGYRSRAQ